MGKSPSKTIFSKLILNVPASFGLLVIFGSVFVAFFGVLLIPDRSINANEGVSELRKQPSGTKVTFLKPRKAFPVESQHFFYRLFIGDTPDYTLIAIKSFEIKTDGFVYYESWVGEKDRLPLVVFCDEVLKNAGGSYFSINEEELSYQTSQNHTATISLRDAKGCFEDVGYEDRIFFLGTDSAGRDIFSRLVYGAKISVSVGFVSVSISLLVGVLIGALAGYTRGALDSFLMWLVTVVWSIPGIMIIIAISLALNSKGIWVVFVAVGLTMWVDVARVVRGQFLEAREYLYVEAARALGVSKFRIITRHILPNISGPIIVMATANFASAILIEAGLSFIGIGVEPPTPSWGAMVREGYNMMSADIIGDSGGFGVLLYPSLCISALVFAFNLLGNGLRDAIDPKNK